VGDGCPAAGDCDSPELGPSIGPDVSDVGISPAGDAVRPFVEGGSVGASAGDFDGFAPGVDGIGAKVGDGSPAAGDCVALTVGLSIGADVSDVGISTTGDAV